jgi:hypothetical protein
MFNKLKENCITLVSLYWYPMMHGQQNINSHFFPGKSVRPVKTSSHPPILRNLKWRHRVSNCQPLVPILNYVNSVHDLPSYSFKIHFNNILLSKHISKLSTSFSFPRQSLTSVFSSSIRATWPAHPIFFDYINRVISGEEKKSWSS